MVWVGVVYYGKYNYYLRINCIRHYVRGEFQIYFEMFSFLFFKGLINLSARTEFPSLCAEYISISLSCNDGLIALLPLIFIHPYFVWIAIRLI